MFQWYRLRIVHGGLIRGEMTPAGESVEGSARRWLSGNGNAPVSSEPFSESVRHLLREALTSFERLEVLLFLHKNASGAFTGVAIGEALHIQAELVEEAAEGLVSCGLLVREDAGAFRFAPATPALASAASELAVAYRDHSAAVLSAMSVNAIERIRSGPMRGFADAFVFWKWKNDR